jgi:hypothetical protein
MADGERAAYARFGQRFHAPNGGGFGANRCQDWVRVKTTASVLKHRLLQR